MATDFCHSEEIINAVIAVLKGDDGASHTGGLPATWFPEGGDGTEASLKHLEHGDYADYAIDSLEELCPAILVRSLGPQPTKRGGTGGVIETEETIRVVHMRAFNQCRTSAGAMELNMSRARARYAKIITKALFNDPQHKLATINSGNSRAEVSLTCTDSAGAQVLNALWAGWDLGHSGSDSTADVARIRAGGHSPRTRAVGEAAGLRPAGEASRLWAIACDIEVRVRTGGDA